MTLEEKALAVTRLYANKDFQELIIDEFITNGIHNLVLTDNVDSDSTRDQLKARRILYQFLYDIIQEAEIANIENKER